MARRRILRLEVPYVAPCRITLIVSYAELGLFVQVVFFGLFVIAAAVFQYRLTKAPTALSSERPWQKHMIGLYLVSVLIFVRSIVRCVEYIEGFFGYIIEHEPFLYVFDATPMFLAVIAMNWSHPGEVARYIREAGISSESVREGETVTIDGEAVPKSG